MPEDRRLPLIEVWKTENGTRSRVYRGRRPEQIAWKLDYHKLNHPEQVLIEAGRHDVGGPELQDS